MEKPKEIAVIGLGLLGASLGMALRGRPDYRRLGWARRTEVGRWAVANDVVDAVLPLEEILRRADLTVLCLPVPAIAAFLRDHAGRWKPDAVVTDVGSVKAPVEAAARAALEGSRVRFVGSHPMAGTEFSGPEAAFPALYRDAEVFVCPGACSDEGSAALVEALWRDIGTRTHRIAPDVHDELVANTSHLSHLLACALVLAVFGDAPPGELPWRYAGCATGFRDTSRIASSSPVMWREIIENNAVEVVKAARNFERRFAGLARLIEAGDFDAFEQEFAAGRALRDGWLAYKESLHP